ncbi:hypothetical protein SH611_22950 [Geminicoccaceae bacterium 1502E]|nr:hypothetical protein [Geminicoccaceae bacterium 1502E]
MLLDAGESIRTIGAALEVAPSTVPEWAKLRRETGGLAPGRMGGHVPRKIRDGHAAWLLERLATPFTLRQLVAELAGRGLRVAWRTVWNFVHEARLSFKKSADRHGAGPA